MKALTITLLLALPLCSKAALVKVVLGKASAKANTELGTGSKFSTGSKSNSEVALENGVVRAGSNTTVKVAGEDNITLEKGLTLVASKPRLFRKSINVQTPGHQLKIKGTAQIYHDPGRSIRVAVIEGRMTVSLNSMSREHVTLEAGQVLLINPAETELPDPLEIDLSRLVSSARLMADQFERLPTTDLVEDASRRQTSEHNAPARDVVSTSRDIEGNGSDIGARSEELVHMEIADDIDDLDGDGEDDGDILDDLDGEDDGNDADLDENDGPDDGNDGDGGGDGGDGGDAPTGE